VLAHSDIHVFQLLCLLATQADAASSSVASRFLAGALPLDQFVLEYTELRAKHHVVDLKRQAAEQLLRAS
jgi:hypothetical protein